MNNSFNAFSAPEGIYFLIETPRFWYFQDWDDVRCTRDVLTKMLDEHEAKSPAPEAGREEAEKPLVGESPAGEPGVQPAPPLLEPPKE